MKEFTHIAQNQLNLTTFQKGSIADALDYGNNAVTFKKKGKEIKEALAKLLPKAEAEVEAIYKQILTARAACGEGNEPTEDFDDDYSLDGFSKSEFTVVPKLYSDNVCYPRNEQKEMVVGYCNDVMMNGIASNFSTQEAIEQLSQLCRDYNSKVRRYMRAQAECLRIKLLINNIVDNTEVTLSSRQIAALGMY